MSCDDVIGFPVVGMQAQSENCAGGAGGSGHGRTHLGRQRAVSMVLSVPFLEQGGGVAEEEHAHREGRVDRLAKARAVAQLLQQARDAHRHEKAAQQERPPRQAVVAVVSTFARVRRVAADDISIFVRAVNRLAFVLAFGADVRRAARAGHVHYLLLARHEVEQRHRPARLLHPPADLGLLVVQEVSVLCRAHASEHTDRSQTIGRKRAGWFDIPAVRVQIRPRIGSIGIERF